MSIKPCARDIKEGGEFFCARTNYKSASRTWLRWAAKKCCFETRAALFVRRPGAVRIACVSAPQVFAVCLQLSSNVAGERVSTSSKVLRFGSIVFAAAVAASNLSRCKFAARDGAGA